MSRTSIQVSEAKKVETIMDSELVTVAHGLRPRRRGRRCPNGSRGGR
jgi:hypothetical protein